MVSKYYPRVFINYKGKRGNSLVVQWLGLCASTARGTGSIPDRGTKIPHAAKHGRETGRQTDR